MTDDRLSEVTARLRSFAAERNLGRFHNPKNLAMAIAGEAGELAAEYQWLTPGESDASAEPGEFRERVAGEVADVAIYLLLLVDRLGLDLYETISAKMDANDVRFPSALSTDT